MTDHTPTLLYVITVCPKHKVRGRHGDPLVLTEEQRNWTMCDWPGGREMVLRKIEFEGHTMYVEVGGD